MPNPLHDPRYITFRQALVDERERRGLTQVEIATRLGKPQSFISKYERGERRLDIIELIDIAVALEADPATLFRNVADKIGR